MECESCKSSHDGDYGSGRFCSSKCARGFSTREKRQEINRKLAIKVKSQDFSKFKDAGFADSGVQKRYVALRIEKNEQKDREFLEHWMAGRVIPRTRGIARRLLLKYVHSACLKCGWAKVNPRTGRSPLELEHLNGVTTDHRYENLTILCPNCHSLTDTWRVPVKDR